ncbi:helix-turn-helix domain-containing protein [Rhizobium lentis]|nr:helix-turn-helix domain-containing protein [Rhizobium lentis]
MAKCQRADGIKFHAASQTGGQTMPAGRPTDWTPTLGEEILQLMSAGLSLAAAAAELGIHRQRVYEWVDRYPEFADTVKLAMAKRQLFLERRLLSADVGPVVTSTIFALKNAGAEDWRDKQELEHKGQVSLTPVINLNGNAG